MALNSEEPSIIISVSPTLILDGFPLPDDPKTRHFLKEFLESVKSAFRRTQEIPFEFVIEWVESESYRARVLSLAAGSSTISLDPRFEGDYQLRISRIFDPSGSTSSILCRASSPELCGVRSFEDQLSQIPAGTYTLVEDEVATGKTLLLVVDALKTRNVFLERVVCCHSNGYESMSNLLDPVPFQVAGSCEKWLGLTALRDWFCGSSCGGAAVCEIDEVSRMEKRVRLPYLYPCLSVKGVSDRADVPSKHVFSFSCDVWRALASFWEHFPQKTVRDCSPSFLRSNLAQAFQTVSMMEFCKRMSSLCEEKMTTSDCRIGEE